MATPARNQVAAIEAAISTSVTGSICPPAATIKPVLPRTAPPLSMMSALRLGSCSSAAVEIA